MEDDCAPIDSISNFVSRLTKIKKYLDESDDWYLFLGGAIEVKNSVLLNKVETNVDNLFMSGIAYCTHLIIYNHKIYDYVLNHAMDVPLDHAWRFKYDVMIPIPFIATQYDAYSDILKTNYSYDQRIRKNSDELRKYMKRTWYSW